MAAPARYREHVERLAALIQDGSLPAGSRLMPHRDYADEHGIAAATVARVYSALIERGLAIGEVGRGTFVRTLETQVAAEFSQTSEREPGLVDLAFNYPVLPEQAAQLRHALRALSDKGDLSALLDYHPHPGRREDREAAASWFSLDGAPIAAADIMVCGGSQHALSVVLAALVTARDLVAVESLTYPGFKSAAKLLGIPLAGVQMDAAGIVPESLDAVCRQHAGRVRLVYTMPTVHNPTGAVMPLERRLALIEVARRHGLLLVDDSVYGFLEASPPPSLRSLAPDCVIEIHSLSKSAAPGLRVGYMVAPERVRQRLHEGLRATMWSASAIAVALATAWMRDGTLGNWIVAKRQEARLRQDLARRILGSWPVTAHPASFHLLLDLPEHWRPDDLVFALARRGVHITPLSAFAAPSVPVRRTVRIAMAAPATIRQLELGLQTVAETLNGPPFAQQ
ncbi:PLP-dependent aminotransferase family protein [Cupriavidus basilensis]|uniref:PLP-dependent aminotransferase family protein n=1 Tax=Cupriavidus basilensis TaxID=68895 RepID=A0ABT6AYM4_9BURK|nr:PLP-dependent aminotransferase family protein [Cupriavidus basilensis]MDF3837463.1 PLP-dependent aminotransferase family protein [Cupriavidus basilensis]